MSLKKKLNCIKNLMKGKEQEFDDFQKGIKEIEGHDPKLAEAIVDKQIKSCRKRVKKDYRRETKKFNLK